jgi:RNA polymerase sigma-70 factor (ECF subfamily)
MQVRLAGPLRKKSHAPRATTTDPLAPVVAQVASGDRAAFRVLYDATSARVFGLALEILRERASAEEAVIDVYAQIWKQAARYDLEKGSVLAWIATLARTRAIDIRRARTRTLERETSVDDVRLESLGESGPDPLDATLERERVRLVRGALDRLPREQRRAVEAAFFGGLSHTEIAHSQGQPLGTVKTRIRSGLAALHQALARTGGELE